jgi:uncharacterized delta-60 repeat protein
MRFVVESLEGRVLMSGLPAGSLDPSFGMGGIVRTAFAVGGETANAVALQPDGKIVVVGGQGTLSGASWVVARYNSDGSLDATFSNGGEVVMPFPASQDGAALSVLIQPDGKIVVGGYVGLYEKGANAGVVVRYDAGGTLDNSFGIGGEVAGMPGSFAYVSGVALQGDGKIVLAGSDNGLYGPTSILVDRLNADGSVDTSFGTGGTSTGFDDGSADPIIVAPDGTIIEGGSAVLQTGQVPSFALVRYSAAGSVLGSNVLPYDDGQDFSGVTALAIQPADDRIVAAGYIAFTPTSFDRFELARFNPDLSIDATFGTGGQVITDFGHGHAGGSGVVVQPSDGKIVAAWGESDIHLVRLDGDGTLDTSFGASGTVSLPVNLGVSDQNPIWALAPEPDGDLLAAGTAIDAASNGDFALARFLGAPTSTSTPPPALTPTVTVNQVLLTTVDAGTGKKLRKERAYVIDLNGALSATSADDIAAYSVRTGTTRRKAIVYQKAVPLMSAIYDPTALSVTLLPKNGHTFTRPEQLTIDASLITDANGQSLNGGKTIVATMTRSAPGLGSERRTDRQRQLHERERLSRTRPWF